MYRCYGRKMICFRERSGGKIFFEFPFLEERNYLQGRLSQISNDVLKMVVLHTSLL